MKSREEIIGVLKSYLDSVYCDTCEHDDSSRCDECHRKAMNWGISDKFAEQIANEILED